MSTPILNIKLIRFIPDELFCFVKHYL